MQGQPYIINTDSSNKKELTHLCMDIMRSYYYDEPVSDPQREWLNLNRKYYFFGSENVELEKKCRIFLNLYVKNFDIIKEYPCFKPFKNYFATKEGRRMYFSNQAQTEVFDIEKLIDSTMSLNGNVYNFKSPAELNLVSGEQITNAITSQINTLNSNIEKNANNLSK